MLHFAQKFSKVLVLTMLAGCSGGFGTMDGIMSSWLGAPLDEVISQWGYPSQQYEVAGHRLYNWVGTQTTYTPATTTGTVTAIGNMAYINATTVGGGYAQWSCTRTLEVNKKNIVVNWQWGGNNCPFAEAMQYANWRRKSPAMQP